MLHRLSHKPLRKRQGKQAKNTLISLFRGETGDRMKTDAGAFSCSPPAGYPHGRQSNRTVVPEKGLGVVGLEVVGRLTSHLIYT
jgi:hypothetical protein